METRSEEDDTDQTSLTMNELKVNDNENLEGLMNYTENAKSEDGKATRSLHNEGSTWKFTSGSDMKYKSQKGKGQSIL